MNFADWYEMRSDYYAGNNNGYYLFEKYGPHVEEWDEIMDGYDPELVDDWEGYNDYDDEEYSHLDDEYLIDEA